MFQHVIEAIKLRISRRYEMPRERARVREERSFSRNKQGLVSNCH
jgi:hypothetical protein